MVQADADIMLIDEVLAVGDAAFAQKCMDVFREKRRAGKTIVLVTHDMTTVQTLCHRAMLLHDGELRYIGEPEDAALAYYRMNFARRGRGRGRGAKRVDVNARVVTGGDGGGDGSTRSRRASRSELDVVLEAARPLERPSFIFHVRNDEGRPSSSSPAARRPSLAAGARGARRAGREPAAARPLHARPLHPRARGGGRHDRAGPAAAGFRVTGTPRRLAAGRPSRPTSSRWASERRARGAARRPGPSALGGGWRRALELLYLIAAFDFKRHYFGTALGYVWSIARPLMLFGVLLAVFTQVFRLGSEVPHYEVLLLLNIVLFGFFQEATGARSPRSRRRRGSCARCSSRGS